MRVLSGDNRFAIQLCCIGVTFHHDMGMGNPLENGMG